MLSLLKPKALKSVAAPVSAAIFQAGRHVATPSANAVKIQDEIKAPQYEVVKFVKEDFAKVFDEVPDFKFYYIGDDDPKENIYKDVKLDTPVFAEGELEWIAPTKPEMKYSKLENGLRVASMDKHGLTSSLGLFIDAGSKWEDPSNLGVSHMIEMVAFKGTAHLSELRQYKTFETLGADGGCIAGREHIVYHAEFLREYLPFFVPLLIGNVLFPRLLPWEVDDCVNKVEKHKKKLEQNHEQIVTELLHAAAWHNNTLGLTQFATTRSMKYFNPDTIRNFMVQHFSPDRMVLVGVNMEHEELAKWAMRSFVDYNTVPPTKHDDLKPVYTGGDCRQEAPIDLTHVAIGFETLGWNSDDVVPVTVLQTLLGGGGSFSTGGPGKGLHTRLFCEVLCKHHWVETAYAFNTMYSNAGIFGIYGVGAPAATRSLVETLCHQLAKMGTVTEEELQRAKTSLKTSISMNLESRQLIMEDTAKQLLMSGKVLPPEYLYKHIDQCTAADIKRVVTQMLQKRPAVAAFGEIAQVPHYDEFCSMLKKSMSK